MFGDHLGDETPSKRWLPEDQARGGVPGKAHRVPGEPAPPPGGDAAGELPGPCRARKERPGSLRALAQEVTDRRDKRLRRSPPSARGSPVCRGGSRSSQAVSVFVRERAEPHGRWVERLWQTKHFR